MAAKKIKNNNIQFQVIENMTAKEKRALKIIDIENNKVISFLKKYPNNTLLCKMKKTDQTSLKAFLEIYLLQINTKMKAKNDSKKMKKEFMGAGLGAGFAALKGGAIGVAGFFGAIGIPLGLVGAGLGYLLLKGWNSLSSDLAQGLNQFVAGEKNCNVQVGKLIDFLLELKKVIKV